MKVNEAYFRRLQGPWTFDPDFIILSWRDFAKASISHSVKLKIAAFVLSQKFLGRYQMKTFVDYTEGSEQVRHTTVVKKFGIQIVRSEKIFRLDENGFDVYLSGVEYYWPMSHKAIPFSPMSGKVEASATRAQYGMPLVGLQTECFAVMESPQASIKIQLPWFIGIFNFTKDSMKELESRDRK